MQNGYRDCRYGKKKKASTVDSSGDESSSEEEDLNVRRALLTSRSNPSVRIGTVDEFQKRYRCDIPMYQQFSEAICKRMRKDHTKRTSTYIPLREVVVTIRFNPTVGTKHRPSIRKRKSPQPQLGTSGKVLKLKKKTISNNFGPAAPLFLAYLETLMYSYVLCSMKDEIDSMRLTRIPLVGVVF